MRFFPVRALCILAVVAGWDALGQEAGVGAAFQALEAQQDLVLRLEGQIAAQQEAIDRIFTDRRSVAISLERAESSIAVQTQAGQLVAAQLGKRLKNLETSSPLSPEQQERLTNYRRHIQEAGKTYDRAAELKKLAETQAKLLKTRTQINQALRQPVEQLRETWKNLDEARLKHAKLREALAEEKLRAANLASKSAPAFLEKVVVTGRRNRVIYEAEWKKAGMPREFQIAKLNRLIEAQRQLLEARQAQLDRWREILRMRNAECEQLLAEGEDARWRQFWRIPAAEMSVAAENVAWGKVTPPGYRVLLEAGDRLLLVATGTGAWTYEPTGSLHSHGLISPVMEEQLEALDWSETQRVINLTSRDRDTRQIYGNAGLQDFADIWVSAAHVPTAVATADLAETDAKVDGNAIWVEMVKRIDEHAIATTRERLPEIELTDETRQTWKDFAKADARRMGALASFKACAALRWVDGRVLRLLLDSLDRATDRGPAPSLDRLLVRKSDQPLERRRDYRVNLTFSRPDVPVSQVTLGETRVEPDPAEKSSEFSWQGRIRFETAPPHGQLIVETQQLDADLDDPLTAARLEPIGNNWLGYEPGPDRHHRLLTARPAQRSYVIVYAPGADVEQATTAAAAVFKQRDFQGGDELALFLANEQGVGVRAVSFTQNHAHLWETLKSAPGRETPLPAEAIVAAGRYLYTQGRGQEKRLILIANQASDGLEIALDAVRKMGTIAEGSR